MYLNRLIQNNRFHCSINNKDNLKDINQGLNETKLPNVNKPRRFRFFKFGIPIVLGIVAYQIYKEKRFESSASESIHFWFSKKQESQNDKNNSTHINKSESASIDDSKKEIGLSVSVINNESGVDSSKSSQKDESATNQADTKEITKNEIETAKQQLIEETRQKINSNLISSEKIKVIEDIDQFDLISLENPENQIILLTVPVFLTTEAIKLASTFIEQFSKISPQNLSVFVQIISNRQDFEKFEQITKTPFIDEDNSFKTLAIFNKSLEKFNLFDLMDLKYKSSDILYNFQPIEKPQNKTAFNEILESMTKEDLFLGFCDKNENNSEKKLFHNFLFENRQLSLKKVVPVYIPSQNDYFTCTPGDLLVLLKTKQQNNEKVLLIDDKPFYFTTNSLTSSPSILELNEKLGNELTDFSIFRNPFIATPPKKFRIDFQIDKNQIDKLQIDKLCEIVSKAKTELGEKASKFDFNLNFQELKKESTSITAVDNELFARQMLMLYRNQDKTLMLEEQVKNPLLFTEFSHEFKFTDDKITKETLLKFCDDLLENKAKFNYRSQKIPQVHHFARKVVGSEFKNKILLSDYNQIIFYHSQHCGGCKKFLPLFEELAKDNLTKPDTDLTFNRIDNEKNQSEFQEVYLSTPKIIIYRKDLKAHPYEYRSNMLTKSLLQKFISATLSYSVINDWESIKSFGDSFSDTYENDSFSKIAALN